MPTLVEYSLDLSRPFRGIRLRYKRPTINDVNFYDPKNRFKWNSGLPMRKQKKLQRLESVCHRGGEEEEACLEGVVES